jgi:hypothetical protein
MLTVTIAAVIRYVLKVLPLLLLLLSSSTDDIRFRLRDSFVAPGKTKFTFDLRGHFRRRSRVRVLPVRIV